MSQSKKVESYYDFLAEHYDAATKGKFEWTPPAEAERLITPFLAAGSRVLDVGIGTGQSADYLRKIGCTVCGLDISERMLEITRAKYPEFELLKADLNADLTMLQGRRFDAILSVGVFEFVTDLKRTITRLVELLAPDGQLCFTFEEHVAGHALQSEKESTSGTGEIRPGVSLEFKHHRYAMAEMKDLLASCGLAIGDAKAIHGYYKTAEMIPIKYAIVRASRSQD